MTNINLSNFLKTLDPDTNICIGSNNGSAFMYFGKPRDTKEIKNAFDNYKKEKIKDLEKNKLSMISILNNHDQIDSSNYMTVGKAIHERYYCILGIKRYFKEYKDPLKRIVKESYTKTIDDCVCILIDGSERGNYWFKDEFDKDNKK